MASLHLRALPLLLLCVALPAVSDVSQETSHGHAQGCSHPFLPGTYRGSGEARFVAQHPKGLAPEDGNYVWTYTATISDVTLKVECDGRVTGSSTTTFSVDATFTATDGPDGHMWGPGQDRERLEGTVEAGPNGLPLFRLTGTVESGVFHQHILVNLDPSDVPEAHPYFEEDVSLDGNSASFVMQGASSSGDLLRGTDPSGLPSAFSVATLAFLREGFDDVTPQGSWELAFKNPVVATVDAQYEQAFLAGVPLQNRYTATVDWKDNAPGRVTFTLNGAEREADVSGNTASIVYDMGSDFLADQENTLVVRAYAANGDPSPALTLRPEVYSVPTWASPASKFTTSASGKTVTYRTSLPFPPQSFDLFVDVPSYVPILGGRWGLSGTQLDVGIGAASSGSVTSDRVSGRPRFSLGAKDYNATVGGNTDSWIARNQGLDLLNGTATYEFPRLKTEYTVGLLSLIPGLETAVSQTVLEDVVATVNQSAGLRAAVEAGLRADGTFNDGPTSLKWTGLSGTGDARVGLTGNFSPPVVRLLLSLMVSGGGTGSLTIGVAPEPKVTKGSIGLFFELLLRLLGQETAHLQKEHTWTFPSALTVASTQPLEPVRFQVEERPPLPPNYARFVGGQSVQSQAVGSRSVVSQTIVQQEYLTAQPQLATGSNGQAALAWVHDDPAKPSQQGKEIVASRFDGTAWGAPQPLTADTNPDFAPAVAVDGSGNVGVVWMRNIDAALPSTITLDSAYLAGFDIWTSRYDATSGAWSSPEPLDTNSTFDHSPRVVASSDGTLLAVWVNNPGNRLLGTTAQPEVLMYSVWRNGSWSTAVPIATVPGLLDWDVAMGVTGTVATLAVARDVDGSLTTTSDWELSSATWDGATWSGLTSATNDTAADDSPRVTYDSTNTPHFFWRRDGALVTAVGALTATPETLASEVLPPTVAAGPEDRLAVIWASPTVSGTNLVGLTYRNGRWSLERQIAADPEVANHSASAGYLPDGRLLVGYGQTSVTLSNQTLSTGDVLVDVAHLGSFSDLVVATVAGDINYTFVPVIIDDAPPAPPPTSPVPIFPESVASMPPER